MKAKHESVATAIVARAVLPRVSSIRAKHTAFPILDDQERGFDAASTRDQSAERSAVCSQRIHEGPAVAPAHARAHSEHTHTQALTHTRVHTHTHTQSTHTRTHNKHTHVRTCTHTNTHTYVHAHTHTKSEHAHVHTQPCTHTAAHVVSCVRSRRLVLATEALTQSSLARQHLQRHQITQPVQATLTHTLTHTRTHTHLIAMAAT